MTATTRVLMLSAHDGQVDRRILAEANALADSGRQVTLLNVPAIIPPGCLREAVRVVMPAGPHPVSDRHGLLKRILRACPAGLYDWIRSRRYGLGRGPAEPLIDFFSVHAPAEPFDVVHCHDLPTLPAAVRLAQGLNAQFIYDSHELFPFQFEDRRIESYWMDVERAHIGRCDAVIAVNDSIAAEMNARYGIPRPSVLYNSYGVGGSVTALPRERFAAHFGAPPEGYTVLYQGDLTPGRNLETLVRAFSRSLEGGNAARVDSLGGGHLARLGSEAPVSSDFSLLTSHISHPPTARLFLLGDGPLKPSLQRLANPELVFFGPFVPQAELLGYTAAADLGIIPYLGGASLNTRYCTPNKLFEFIEAGVPICASDLPELRKIIVGHSIGQVFPMGSPEQIAAAIEACRTASPPSQAARQAAREYYSWSRQAAGLLGLYDQLGGC